MDITIQIMLVPPTHDLSASPEKDAARYRRGDIVSVYLSSEITEAPSPASRLGFVHITAVPDSIPFSKIKSELLSSSYDPVILIDPDVWRKRKWRIPASVLPVDVRNTLLADREVTFTWSQVKPYVRKKIIYNKLNSSTDDESNVLVDVDVE